MIFKRVEYDSMTMADLPQDIQAEILEGVVNKLAIEHGLKPGIKVEIDGRLSRTLGRAYYKTRRIVIHPWLIETPANLDDTLRHELAHILSWETRGYAGHGEPWKECAVILGARPLAYQPFDHSNLRTNLVRYIYECPRGCKIYANRKRRSFEQGYTVCKRHNLTFTRKEVN